MRYLFSLFVLVCSVVPALAQEVVLNNTQIEQLKHELAHERLIRIVEPVIYPLQLMTSRNANWDALGQVCTFEHQTEVGQASVYCKITPEPEFFIEGPNPPDRLFGNKTIEVTIWGYSTHEHFRIVGNARADDPNRRCCEQKDGSLLTVKPVVVAHFTIITKFFLWDENETAAANKLRRMFRGPNFQAVKVGDVRGYRTTILPIKYEFLDEKK